MSKRKLNSKIEKKVLNVKDYTIEESFKEYCKEKHKEDKKYHNSKNYDYMQEVFSQTELFDLTNVTDMDYILEYNRKVYKTYKKKGLKNIVLPFGSVYARLGGTLSYDIYGTDYVTCAMSSNNKYSKIGPYNYIYLHEFSPEIITGTLVYNNDYHILFSVNVNKGTLQVDIKPYIKEESKRKPMVTVHDENNNKIITKPMESLRNDISSMLTSTNSEVVDAGKFIMEEFENATSMSEILLEESIIAIKVLIYHALNIICNLPVYSTCADKANHPKTEYYSRKKAPVIKREQPPIYYILDKSEEKKPNKVRNIKARGHLEFTHSFKVRSHWRTINSTSYGKDRYGRYNVKGMTFVREYIKGEGELARRLRIVKLDKI